MLKVEQSDRDAAAEYYYRSGGSPNIGRDILAGKKDAGFRVQAFAKYREAIMERAASMAEQHEPVGYMSDRERSYCIDHGQEIADIIRKHGGTHDQG